MKNRLVLILLVVFLSSSTEIYQFFKIPFLVEHYLKHKEEGDSLSFLTFLEVHYSHHIKYDEDHEEDSKLPFKSCCHLSTGIGITAVEPCTHLPLSIKEVFCIKNEFFLSNSDLLPASCPVSIWQPPKSC